MSKPVPISETESISEHLGLDEEEKEEEEIKFELRPLRLPPRANVGVTKNLMVYCPIIRADSIAELCFTCKFFGSVNFISLSIVCNYRHNSIL